MSINKSNKTKNQNNFPSKRVVDLQLMEKRVQKLTIRLWAGMFLMFIMLAVGVISFYYEEIALALSGDYNKGTGAGQDNILTAADWNNLDDDFKQTLNCKVKSVTLFVSPPNAGVEVSCDPGWVLTGGACDVYNPDSNWPDSYIVSTGGTLSYRCHVGNDSASTVTAFANCCQLN
jgi:hypothetical protein